ncbi:MAG: PKD domain-containing protein [Chitinophagaceae bacterium]|nr:MAG: PKD domain-containing protein [Chitinophagaceae bacterium]
MRKIYFLLCLLLSGFLGARAQDNAHFTYSAQGLLVNFQDNSQYADTADRIAYWSFGDGTGSTGFPYYTVPHYYTQPGVYNVCVRLYRTVPFTDDTVALTGQYCQTITVAYRSAVDSCVVSFSPMGPGFNFLPANFSFFAQSANNNNRLVTSYCWNFGDGSPQFCTQGAPGQPAEFSAGHSYAAAGTYNVCVTASFGAACTATRCNTITVAAPPADTCSTQILVRAEGGPATRRRFDAYPNHNNFKPVSQIVWNFGDGRDTTIHFANGYNYSPIYHNYAANGTYNVCATVTFQGGCVSTRCETIVVRPDSCATDFTHHFRLGGGSLRPYFNLLANSNNGRSPVQACWTWGDGSPVTCNNAGQDPSNGTNANHQYSAAGTYNVCLTTTFDGGCTATRCRTITLVDSTAAPDSCSASFTTSLSGPGQYSRNFFAQPWSSRQRIATRICWNFGDGSSQCFTSQGATPAAAAISHGFPGPGTYNVCVTITYDGGCVSTRCQAITFAAPADSCTVNFSNNWPNATPNVMTFNGIATNSRNRPAIKACWTFGDGSAQACFQGSAAQPASLSATHTFAQAGTYNVCLTVTFDSSCVQTYCRNITVTLPRDTCGGYFAGAQVDDTTGLTWGFIPFPWHSNQKRVTRICWQFGDGRDTCINTTNPNSLYSINHRYAQPGTYNACMTLTFEGGCVSTSCYPVTVNGIPAADTCRAAYTWQPIAGTRAASFSAQPWHNLQRPVSKICWNWGNGTDTCVTYPNGYNSQPLAHSFPAPGTYMVCATITYRNGCVSTYCDTVRISGSTPPPAGCTATFTDTALSASLHRFEASGSAAPGDSIVSYRWIFGDGTGAFGRVVQHTYLSGGTYTVTLVLRTRNNCEARFTRSITINAPMVTLLNIHPNPVGATLNANFSATASGTATIRIVSTTGLVVYTQTRGCVAGPNAWSFTLPQLAPGLYTMIVQAPGQYVVGVFLKQ